MLHLFCALEHVCVFVDEWTCVFVTSVCVCVCVCVNDLGGGGGLSWVQTSWTGEKELWWSEYKPVIPFFIKLLAFCRVSSWLPWSWMYGVMTDSHWQTLALMKYLLSVLCRAVLCAMYHGGAWYCLRRRGRWSKVSDESAEVLSVVDTLQRCIWLLWPFGVEFR